MNEACQVENNVIVFRCKKFVLKYISERKMEDNNMISFASDYIAGAHPVIMQRLLETNMENMSGYGTDQYCAQAKEKDQTGISMSRWRSLFLSRRHTDKSGDHQHNACSLRRRDRSKNRTCQCA